MSYTPQSLTQLQHASHLLLSFICLCSFIFLSVTQTLPRTWTRHKITARFQTFSQSGFEGLNQQLIEETLFLFTRLLRKRREANGGDRFLFSPEFCAKTDPRRAEPNRGGDGKPDGIRLRHNNNNIRACLTLPEALGPAKSYRFKRQTADRGSMSPAGILNVSGAEIQNVMALGFDCFLFWQFCLTKSVQVQRRGCAAAT